MNNLQTRAQEQEFQTNRLYIYIYIHTYIHTYTRIHTHTYICTYKHLHTPHQQQPKPNTYAHNTKSPPARSPPENKITPKSHAHMPCHIYTSQTQQSASESHSFRRTTSSPQLSMPSQVAGASNSALTRSTSSPQPSNHTSPSREGTGTVCTTSLSSFSCSRSSPPHSIATETASLDGSPPQPLHIARIPLPASMTPSPSINVQALYPDNVTRSQTGQFALTRAERRLSVASPATSSSHQIDATASVSVSAKGTYMAVPPLNISVLVHTSDAESLQSTQSSTRSSARVRISTSSPRTVNPDMYASSAGSCTDSDLYSSTSHRNSSPRVINAIADLKVLCDKVTVTDQKHGKMTIHTSHEGDVALFGDKMQLSDAEGSIHESQHQQGFRSPRFATGNADFAPYGMNIPGNGANRAGNGGNAGGHGVYEQEQLYAHAHGFARSPRGFNGGNAAPTGGNFASVQLQGLIRSPRLFNGGGDASADGGNIQAFGGGNIANEQQPESAQPQPGLMRSPRVLSGVNVSTYLSNLAANGPHEDHQLQLQQAPIQSPRLNIGGNQGAINGADPEKLGGKLFSLMRSPTQGELSPRENGVRRSPSVERDVGEAPDSRANTQENGANVESLCINMESAAPSEFVRSPSAEASGDAQRTGQIESPAAMNVEYWDIGVGGEHEAIVGQTYSAEELARRVRALASAAQGHEQEHGIGLAARLQVCDTCMFVCSLR